jgi:hypothetical protein
MTGLPGAGHVMRRVLACLAAFFVATAAAAEPVAVGFADLPDPAAQDFEDPFRAMGSDNLVELKKVVQLRARLAENDVAPEARPRLAASVAEASAALEAEGYDIDALIGRRWEIAEKRRAAMLAVNPALKGQEVAIAGYLIPAPRDADGTATGYLVSAVGLCSHLPPPPPNQLLRVRLVEATLPERTNLYTPVRVTGTLDAAATDETIFVLDGDVRMISNWTLEARVADLLGPAPSFAKDPAARDPLFVSQ